MKRNLLFLLVALLPLVASADEAQDLTLSDVQKSDCVRGSRLRANSNETKRTIVLTKEGTILTVQILGFVSNCATEGFDITPSMSGGSDGEPVSVSLGVKPIEPDVSAICECPFNVSFTLHGLEANSFKFSCWWYEGQVSLTEGEPLTLESITEPVHVGEWYYTIDKVNHTAIVRGVDGETDDLTIPWFTYYEGEDYFVTGIDEAAFLNDKTLSSVNIPTNLTHIGYYAFAYCSNLKDVYCFADQVPTTGSDVFQGTPIASATLHVPAGLIDKYKATAPWNEFGNIVGEGEVTIDGLNYYLNSSFYRAPLIKSNNWEGELDIPSEVSFYGQTYTVTSIAQAAFFDNSKLTKVRIPKSIEYIIRGYYTTNPYEDVPTGLVSPDHMNPFNGCTALESIVVDEDNPGLKSVDGVLFSQDGKGYFPYLTNSYYGTGLCCYPAGARRESYTIPDGVEWISSEAFGDNQYISTLTIPGSMKQIYYNVFTGCSNLKNVYCYAEDVPIAYSVAFKGFPIESATLHVPAGSVEEYKTTSPWNEFGIIEALKPLVTFTKGQMATIVLPTEPDASKGMYFRIDRWEDGKIAFEQELHPQAHTPYIIVPNEDFSIDPNNLDLDDLRPDTATIEGVYFIGWYINRDCDLRTGRRDLLLDATPDCYIKQEPYGIHVGPLRASFSILWRLCSTWEEVKYVLYSADGTKIKTTEEPITYTQDQMATIVLPTVPDASKGKYYRLDRCEEGQIIFEQELHPQAHIPYIIVPSEDFSIDPSALDLAGLSNDTVSIEGISFIGSYTSEELNEPEGFYIDIIDTTPDCGFASLGETGKVAHIGALRAYLQVSWDEPYNHGGSKAPGEKLEIKLKDYGTGITEPCRPSPDPSLYGGEVFDLQGRRQSIPQKGMNIIRYADGIFRKVLIK